MMNRKGFTLAELLIVMAIIVVLAAVAVPTFGKQLETSRETSDMEVIRNAYTLAYTAAVQDGVDGIFNNTPAPGSGITITPNTASDGVATGQNATVAVVIGTVIPGAKFSQNGDAAVPTTTTWQYVNSSFMGLTVPAVCTKTGTLTFKFAFNASGEVTPVDANGDTTGEPLFVPST